MARWASFSPSFVLGPVACEVPCEQAMSPVTKRWQNACPEQPHDQLALHVAPLPDPAFKMTVVDIFMADAALVRQAAIL